MRDFSVEINNLPKDYEYGGKDMMLQAYLWEHIETHVRNAFEEKHKENHNEAKLKELRIAQPWQIVDINFGKIDDKECELLEKLNKLDREKKELIHKLNELKKGKNPEETKDK